MKQLGQAKQSYEIYVDSTKKARELVGILKSNKIDFRYTMDPIDFYWVFYMDLSLDQLDILKGRKSLEEIMEALIASSHVVIDNMSNKTLAATKMLSPVAMHFITSFCITSIKVGSVIVNDGCVAARFTKEKMQDNQEIVEAAHHIASGTGSLVNWIKNKLNK